MNDVPDWLWQGIATNLLADSLVAAGWLAWKYRGAIAQTLSRQPVVKNSAAHLKMSFSLSGHPVKVTVASERLSLYDIEAPTPSLARRLEDLAAWYLHVL
jgi:hypothetical protein